jgi:hypothetical protein
MKVKTQLTNQPYTSVTHDFYLVVTSDVLVVDRFASLRINPANVQRTVFKLEVPIEVIVNVRCLN